MAKVLCKVRQKGSVILPMTSQNEIIRPLPLLDARGHITEEGWARHPYWRYDRSRIQASWHRIKEWDYYAIISHDGGYGITVTLSDLSYAAAIAICWLDFNRGTFRQIDSLKLLTRGKIGFPSSSAEGDLVYSDKTFSIRFIRGQDTRTLIMEAPSFESPDGDRGLKAHLTLQQFPEDESMNIATSWEKNRKAFYYNQKINCMPADGQVILGERTFRFSPEDSFACLDWGRGYWTYQNRWYWSSLSARIDGKRFGFNLGYGFSDRTPASENVLFLDGRVHKLDEVTFHFDEKDYMKPWRFESNDDRLELDFEPVVDRHGTTNLLIFSSFQHQVFGYFSGKVKLDNGETLKLERVLGFAEDVFNRW